MVATLVLANVKYPRLNPSRRQLALDRALEVAAPSSADPTLTALLREAVSANRTAIQIANDWEGRPSRNRYSTPVTTLMQDLARTLGALMQTLRTHQRTFAPGTEPRSWADELVEEALPHGARGITRLPYADQVHNVIGVLDTLQGDGAEAVRGLGLDLWVDRLADLRDQCEAALLEPRISYEQVREADNIAYELWLRVVARVQGLAASGVAADVALATGVFGHFEAQRNEYRIYRARRRRSRDP